VVYKAEDVKLKRLVALKFLHHSMSINAESLKRFEREAQASATINHTNITTIYEIGEYEGAVFIAMEYVGKITLRDKIVSDVPFEFSDTIELFLQILSGIEAAHKSGIIHRDLKPENIIINEKGTAKISDFGLVKFTNKEKITAKGIALGTVAYISPEQLQGKEVDNKTDIWSLGIILFELLTGKTPFEAEYEDSVKYAIMNEPIPKILELREGLPSHISDILNKMVNKNTGDRYDSVCDVINDIQFIRDDILNKTKKIPVKTKNIFRLSFLLKTFVPLFIVVILLFVFLFITGDEKSGGELPSIGVLYLKNLGAEEEEYFSYGITEDIIIDLSKAGLIKVPSMNDILTFRQTERPLTDIAEALNVRFVLTGSIHKVMDQLKIRLHLVEPGEEKNLWAERWEEPLTKITEIKNNIVEQITLALKTATGSEIGIQQGKKYNPDPSAYEYYLKGIYLYDHMKTSEDLAVARSFYEKSIEIDSNFVAPIIKLGLTYFIEGDYTKAVINYNKALAAAVKKGYRPEEADVLRNIGTIQRIRGETEKALENFTKAYNISLEQNDKQGECASL
ncbi:MAG: protein kinase, partial [Candidatus Omnitrophica bacterium]|nr:protein kinase [Candidatus Omnitrophota bacterium]